MAETYLALSQYLIVLPCQLIAAQDLGRNHNIAHFSELIQMSILSSSSADT